MMGSAALALFALVGQAAAQKPAGGIAKYTMAVSNPLKALDWVIDEGKWPVQDCRTAGNDSICNGVEDCGLIGRTSLCPNKDCAISPGPGDAFMFPHMINASARPIGAVSVEAVEAAFDAKYAHALSTGAYDAFLDFSLVVYASSLDGPWDSLNAAVVPSAEMGKSWGPARMLDNPTVVFYEDGSLLMASRGGKPGDEAWSDGIVTAPSWRGPYTQHSMIGNASSPRVEDPFLWRDTKGFYHVIFHKFTDEHPNCGGHAFSRDGVHWTLSNSVAFTTTVTTADGAEHAFQRRERPHLLFDDDGRPVYLYTSLTNWTVGALGTDKAFTFAQRIRVV